MGLTRRADTDIMMAAACLPQRRALHRIGSDFFAPQRNTMLTSSCRAAGTRLRPFPSAPVGALLLALTFFALAAPQCAATTYYVSTNGVDSNNSAGTQAAPFLTLQKAFNYAVSGDTVTLNNGTYTGQGDVALDFDGKNITVNSVNGAAATIIDCGGTSTANHRAFYLHTGETNVVISGLTIKNAYVGGNRNSSFAGSGGAVDIESGSTATLANCILSGNTAYYFFGGYLGGGVYNGGTVTLTDCTLSGNTESGNGSGGGIYNGGTATLTNNCTLSGNTASGSGGGIYNGGTATLTNNCTLSGNTASGSGGGVYNGGTVTLTNCPLSGNNASSGGGVYSVGSATMTGCALTQNNASKGSGGCLYNSGTAMLTNCPINNNIASSGGGVYNISFYSSGTATLTGCALSMNTATSGGGLYNSGTATLTSCYIQNNTASTTGGGVYNSSGSGSGNTSSLTLTNCLITVNTASSGNGGGVENVGTTLARFCTFSGNSASGSGAQGGALENDNAVTLTNDIFWADTAPFAAEYATFGNFTNTISYCDIQGGTQRTRRHQC